MERERGLSEYGKEDAFKIIEILRSELIDLFISSPYKRAIETIKGLADTFEKEIFLVEELREREIGVISDTEFKAAKKQVYDNFDFAYPGGESSNQAQQRAVEVLKSIMNTYNGKKIVIGTHGDIMTLMLNYFDKDYGYDFWSSSTMPDIYRTEFMGEVLERVERIWG
jgi:2,3-bisphosphoglycerate-dependent phosphoglycerate mutase